MTMHWYDIAGLVGVLLILIAFFLLQAGKLRGDALEYQLMNAVGALAVLISLFYAFNLSAFLLELLWLLVSIYGIARGRRLRKSEQR